MAPIGLQRMSIHFMSSHKATLCLYGINVIINIIKINIFSLMTSIPTLPTRCSDFTFIINDALGFTFLSAILFYPKFL